MFACWAGPAGAALSSHPPNRSTIPDILPASQVLTLGLPCGMALLPRFRFESCHRSAGEPTGILAAAMSGRYSGLVTVARCDTASGADVADVLAPEPGAPPVQGIVNSGGVLADAVISKQTAAGVR